MNQIGESGMPKHVLLIEDSPGDVRLTREALSEANPEIELSVAADGIEAMSFLNQQNEHSHAPRPDMILLDLNLPLMDGREVLARIKGDDALKTIPTIILTTSQAQADISTSYELQANSYLCKPVRLDEFMDLVKSINDFWMMKAKLPNWPGE